MRMARRGNKMMNEPPAIMLTDLAFNLLIFFVVCASTEPETGRKQQVPSSSKDQANSPQAEQNFEVSLTTENVEKDGVVIDTRHKVEINGDNVPLADFPAKMKTLLSGKTKPEQRLVVVKSKKDTPYHHWIKMTGIIEEAGGIVAILVEESRTVVTP